MLSTVTAAPALAQGAAEQGGAEAALGGGAARARGDHFLSTVALSNRPRPPWSPKPSPRPWSRSDPRRSAKEGRSSRSSRSSRSAAGALCLRCDSSPTAALRNRYLREQLGSERRKGRLDLDRQPLGRVQSSAFWWLRASRHLSQAARKVSGSVQAQGSTAPKPGADVRIES